ncbi:MAG: hypothetical protein IJG32_09035 [Selenomonadaceae bacterium]|nr:hypothetical protein [Selenomonadaceae bacterium]
MENEKVLVLTLRQVDGRRIAAGYISTCGRIRDWFLKSKNPRERGFRQIHVYFNTEKGHEFYAWSAAFGTGHYSFNFQLDLNDMFQSWIKFWE